MLLRFLSTLPDAFTRLPKKCAKIYSCGGFNTPTLASGLLIGSKEMMLIGSGSDKRFFTEYAFFLYRAS